MSQALRNATEILANALHGTPFFFSFSPPLLYLQHIAPSLSLVQGTEPKVVALYWQRGLYSDFSHPVPCALPGPALFMAVTCSLGQTIHVGGGRSFTRYCKAGLARCTFVCVRACLWSHCWRYPIPFIVHLTRIPGDMRVRVEYPDSMYRCLVSVSEGRQGRGECKR